MPKITTSIYNIIITIITFILLVGVWLDYSNYTWIKSIANSINFPGLLLLIPIINLYWLKFTKNKSNWELLKQFLLFLSLYFLWWVFGFLLLAFTEVLGSSKTQSCGSRFCFNEANISFYFSLLFLANWFLAMKPQIKIFQKKLLINNK
jgi:hypothetical protein